MLQSVEALMSPRLKKLIVRGLLFGLTFWLFAWGANRMIEAIRPDLLGIGIYEDLGGRARDLIRENGGSVPSTPPEVR